MTPYFANSTVYETNFVASGFPEVSVNTTANVIRLFPILIGYQRTFTQLACTVSTTSSGGFIRLGVYNINPLSGMPTTKIADSGEMASTSTTDAAHKIATVADFELVQGFYYGAVWNSITVPLRGWSATVSSASSIILDSGVTFMQGISRPLVWGGALPVDETDQVYTAISGVSPLVFGLR